MDEIISGNLTEKRHKGYNEEELIINAKNVPFEICVNDELIFETLTEAAHLMGMKIRASASYKCGDVTPPGAICMVMVDQSFVYCHSFADIGRMSIRVFTCGECDSMKGWNFIKEKLKITDFTVKKETLKY